jgi:hypothetical protein
MKKILVRLAVGTAIVATPLAGAYIPSAHAAGPAGAACVGPGPRSSDTATAAIANAGGYVGAATTWTVSWGGVVQASGSGQAVSQPGVIPAGSIVGCTVGVGALAVGSPTG